ncbi:MAG: SUMF1/EgtB/PvdO family nonheme iron enzyme [Verrucomicrobiota bacterium]|nr:SUMF1/EgtB/PvdO family nonheme iron enzyme [Verrucomicrobiota bacterium]
MDASRLTPMLLQTILLRLCTGLFSALAIVLLAVWLLLRPAWKPRAAFIGGLVLLSAWILRFATPEMAFNSIVRPDGVHFSVTAQELVREGTLDVPTGDARLPPRTLPGPSFLQALTQWIQPSHPGFGIFPIWICAGLTIWLAFALARRMYSPGAGWWAALLVALSPSLAWYSRQLMSEVPWGLLVLAACGGMAFGLDKPGKAFASGLLAGVGMLIKSSHILVLIGLLAGFLFLSLRKKSRLRAAVWMAAGAGMVLGAAPAFLYNRMVLGGYFSTAYHIYWPGWADATQALNIRYLWQPPLINSVMGLGNVPYYLLSLIGLEPRPERLILFPGVLFLLVFLLLRSRKVEKPAVAQPIARARLAFQVFAWSAGSLYATGCLLYSFQEPRFFLPIVPLVFVALSGPLARGTSRTPSMPGLTTLFAPLCLAVLLGLGAAIVRVETMGRVPERRLLQELARTAEAYDILISDEDPVLLTTFGVWTSSTRVWPMLLPGELWFPADPEALYREQHVAVEPFEGTVPIIQRALAEGKSVAAYIRRPHVRPAAWASLNEAFLLTPLFHDKMLRGLYQVGVRPTFYLGAEMPQHFTGVNRSVPLHPFAPAPFELAEEEMDHATFVAFLNDEWAAGRLAYEQGDQGLTLSWRANSLPLCTLREDEPNNAIRFEGPNAVPPFRVAQETSQAMGRRPVVQVSWYGAAACCNWLSRREGLPEAYTFTDGASNVVAKSASTGYRLPTEAEWEWTATWDGRSKRTYAWGDEWAPEYANLYDSPRPVQDGGTPFTLPVDEWPPWTPEDAAERIGPFHLSGNVWEWCEDWFADYATPEQTTELKVLRGGSYRTEQDAAWAAFRGIALPETMTPDIGFRTARTPSVP